MSCPFIFIHTGQVFPELLNDCIQQIHVWNENAEIFLIAPEVHRETAKGCVFTDLAAVPVSHKRLAIQNKIHNEKLFILEDFLEMSHMNECIYLENDMLVSFYLDDMLPLLRRTYKGIAAPYIGKGELSNSMLYVKDAYILSELTASILKWFSPTQDINRMMCRYFLENRHIADFLPTVSNECEIRENDKIFATANGEVFRGVWDSGAHGQYIHEKIVNHTSAFSADQFEYQWLHRDGGLRHPRAHRHGHSWPLYTLKVMCRSE